MNQVILKGNLTRDPEVRPVGNTNVVNFSLAVDNSYKKPNSTDWVKNTVYVDCEAWDSGATAIGQQATKGSTMLVTGTLNQETWEKDGKKQSKLKIRVNSFEFIQKKAGKQENATVPADAGDGVDVPEESSVPF